MDYPSAVKSGHCPTEECQEKRKGGGSCEGEAVPDESQPLQICNPYHGGETQCEVRLGGRHESQTSISAKGNLHCPLYSEKEGLCGVETYLFGTGLKTKGFGVKLC